MKHLLYLLLAGSLLTEQPLYGAKKKGKKTRKIGKKGTIGKKGGASSVAVATSQPLTPTPTQTTKTEAPQTALMTKQQAQKLIDGYLEKYRKDVILPWLNIQTKLETTLKSEKLKTLVENSISSLTNIEDITKKIEKLQTIFNNTNDITFITAKELKEEFNRIVEELKKDLPNQIKEKKTKEKEIVKDLEEEIKKKFDAILKETKKEEKQKLQIEMATLQKEKKTIEEQHPQFMETILTIHNAALSLVENDILKDFLEKLIKEDSAKQSLAKKQASKEEYNKKKETRYANKIQDEKKKRSDTIIKETKEAVGEAITKLEKELKKENDTNKKKELLHQIRQLKERKSRGVPLKSVTKEAEATGEMTEPTTGKMKLEEIKDTLNSKLDENFFKTIEKLNKTRNTLKSAEELKKYVKLVLQKTLEIDEDKMISNKISKQKLINLIAKIITNEQSNGGSHESDYTNTLSQIKDKIDAFNIETKTNKEHKAIYDVINNIASKDGSTFFKGRQKNE